MGAPLDLFENPMAILEPDFDVYQCCVLGVRIGDSGDVLSDWDAEVNEFRWFHVQGGVGFGIKDNVVGKIKLPTSFFDRLEISTPEKLIDRLGKNDEIREITYRDRLHHRGYLWQRGLIFWWELLPSIKASNLILFDPVHGYEQDGRNVTYSLLLGPDCLDRKPSIQIPPVEVRESLRVGDLAKLVFDIKIDAKSFVERMWVRVTKVNSESYLGALVNDPFCTHELKCGMEVQFHSDHVVQVQDDGGTDPSTSSG